MNRAFIAFLIVMLPLGAVMTIGGFFLARAIYAPAAHAVFLLAAAAWFWLGWKYLGT